MVDVLNSQMTFRASRHPDHIDADMSVNGEMVSGVFEAHMSIADIYEHLLCVAAVLLDEKEEEI